MQNCGMRQTAGLCLYVSINLFIPLSLNILNQSISSSLYLPTSLLKNIGVVITNVPQYPCCHRSNQLIFAFINEVLGHLSHELLHS